MKSAKRAGYGVGQRVVSAVSAQGLKRGEEYAVVDVALAFGDFVTLLLEGSDGKRHVVANAHLVLRAVAS